MPNYRKVLKKVAQEASDAPWYKNVLSQIGGFVSQPEFYAGAVPAGLGAGALATYLARRGGWSWPATLALAAGAGGLGGAGGYYGYRYLSPYAPSWDQVKGFVTQPAFYAGAVPVGLSTALLAGYLARRYRLSWPAALAIASSAGAAGGAGGYYGYRWLFPGAPEAAPEAAPAAAPVAAPPPAAPVAAPVAVPAAPAAAPAAAPVAAPVAAPEVPVSAALSPSMTPWEMAATAGEEPIFPMNGQYLTGTEAQRAMLAQAVMNAPQLFYQVGSSIGRSLMKPLGAIGRTIRNFPASRYEPDIGQGSFR